MPYNLNVYPGLHTKIIILMRAVGYDINPKGVCFGITSMAAQAGLIPKNQGLKDFLDRLYRINILHDTIIKQAQEHVLKKQQSNKLTGQLKQEIKQEFINIAKNIINFGKDKEFFENLCENNYIYDGKKLKLYKTAAPESAQAATNPATYQGIVSNQEKQAETRKSPPKSYSTAGSDKPNQIFIDSIQSLDATNFDSQEIVKISCGSRYDLHAFFDGIALYQTSPKVGEILEIDKTRKLVTKRVPAIFNMIAPLSSINTHIVANSQESPQLENIAATTESIKIYQQSDCCGLFDQKHLQDFLTKIESQLKNLNTIKSPIAIRISNFKHAVVILYFPDEKIYRFFDSNNLLNFERSQQTLVNDQGINNIWKALSVLSGETTYNRISFLPLEFSLYSIENSADLQLANLSEIYNQSEKFTTNDIASTDPQELGDSLKDLIRYAIVAEKLDFIKFFLEKYPKYPEEPKCFQDSNFYTENCHTFLLNLALKKPDENLVKQLLDRYKSNFGYEDIKNQMLLAIQEYNYKGLELLLQHSQDLFDRDKLFNLTKTAIITAIENENIELFDLIFNNAEKLLADKLSDLSEVAINVVNQVLSDRDLRKEYDEGDEDGVEKKIDPSNQEQPSQLKPSNKSNHEQSDYKSTEHQFGEEPNQDQSYHSSEKTKEFRRNIAKHESKIIKINDHIKDLSKDRQKLLRLQHQIKSQLNVAKQQNRWVEVHENLTQLMKLQQEEQFATLAILRSQQDLLGIRYQAFTLGKIFFSEAEHKFSSRAELEECQRQLDYLQIQADEIEQKIALQRQINANHNQETQEKIGYAEILLEMQTSVIAIENKIAMVAQQKNIAMQAKRKNMQDRMHAQRTARLHWNQGDVDKAIIAERNGIQFFIDENQQLLNQVTAELREAELQQAKVKHLVKIAKYKNLLSPSAALQNEYENKKTLARMWQNKIKQYNTKVMMQQIACNAGIAMQDKIALIEDLQKTKIAIKKYQHQLLINPNFLGANQSSLRNKSLREYQRLLQWLEHKYLNKNFWNKPYDEIKDALEEIKDAANNIQKQAAANVGKRTAASKPAVTKPPVVNKPVFTKPQPATKPVAPKSNLGFSNSAAKLAAATTKATLVKTRLNRDPQKKSI